MREPQVPPARSGLASGTSRLPRNPAAVFYQWAAKVSAWILGSSRSVQSILLHRSVATGEVSFGRSDIDLLMVIGRDAAREGALLASLCRKVRRLRVVNPVLSHIEVFEPDGISEQARMDTFWASLTRRTAKLLHGQPVEILLAPVRPEHALARFLLWVEWAFARSLQRRNRRDIRKTALESWNAYATADGFIAEPYLIRSEMDVHLRRTEGHASTRGLEEPEGATRLVFELADRLHGSRLPQLQKLASPLVFEATVAPLGLRRLFVVLPRADSPLPPEAFAPLAFPCTPEVLHLYVHFKNAFLLWVLPPELLKLGVTPPSVRQFLRDCRYYCHNRFLCLTGFADANPPAPDVRTAGLRHALEWIARGELPPALPQELMLRTPSGAASFDDYYNAVYGRLRAENLRLQESLCRLDGASPA